MAFSWEEKRAFLRDARRSLYVSRMVGKAADLIVAMVLWHLPGFTGTLAALFYILFADAFPGGRSVGKHLASLKVVRVDREPIDFPSSMLRNLPITVPFLLASIPVVGLLLSATLGIGVLLIEVYLGFYDDDGQRAGDALAGTLVVSARSGGSPPSPPTTPSPSP